MQPVRFVTRLIDDSYVVDEPLQAARHLPRGEQGNGSTCTSTAWASKSTIDLQAVYM
jgi:hypothetical protein